MPPGLIRSQTLAHVPHAFTTRLGGVSSGPAGAFESLNFGNPGDLAPEHRDPMTNIRENWRLVMAALGTTNRELVEVHQVHGAAVHVVRRGERAHAGEHDTRADAIVTDDPGRLLAVRVADCAPVLIASSDGRVVAAVHAGWRGVVAGAASAAVRAMRDIAPGSCDGGLCAAIGPCIGADAFEVEPEVAAEFARVFGVNTPHVLPGTGDRSRIDLKGALAGQLASCGVEPRAIEVVPHCTYHDKRLFFSHRRASHEGGGGAATGRMAAVIGARSTDG